MNASRSDDARINPQDWDSIVYERVYDRSDLEELVAMMALELKNLASMLPIDYSPLYRFGDLPGDLLS